MMSRAHQPLLIFRPAMADLRERLATALSGRYRIEREVGAGGMAAVYLAHDLATRPRQTA
jgi:serine/threonine protein kinase